MNNPEKICNIHQLAGVLDISERRIQQLTRINVLKKRGRNQYELFECLRAYHKYLKRLLKRYMSLYAMVVRCQTHYENLPFYADLQQTDLNLMTFTDEELQKWFKERRY